mmetsp:Transcript_9231/g.16121  ORF Transcript_9231/g.16121 Transcript_9231/m.16121 type:complete len:99 (+) Transcript_9231:128-424(+)
MSDEDKKPKVEDGAASDQINIKVRDQEGNEVLFKIKRSTPLSKLTTAYAARMGVGENSYRFQFDGHRIVQGETPDSLEMEDGDCIDAMVYQQGGSASF